MYVPKLTISMLNHVPGPYSNKGQCQVGPKINADLHYQLSTPGGKKTNGRDSKSLSISNNKETNAIK
jgi:hypothetical protein